MKTSRTRVSLPQATKDMIANLLKSGLKPSAVVKSMPGIRVQQVWPISAMLKKQSTLVAEPATAQTVIKTENTVNLTVAKSKDVISYSVEGVDILLSKKPSSVTIEDNIITFKF